MPPESLKVCSAGQWRIYDGRYGMLVTPSAETTSRLTLPIQFLDTLSLQIINSYGIGMSQANKLLANSTPRSDSS